MDTKDPMSDNLRLKLVITKWLAAWGFFTAIIFSIDGLIFPKVTIEMHILLYSVMIIGVTVIAMCIKGLTHLPRAMMACYYPVIAATFHALVVAPGEEPMATMTSIQCGFALLPFVLYQFSEKNILISFVVISYVIIIFQPFINDWLNMSLQDIGNLRTGPIAYVLYADGISWGLIPLILTIRESYKMIEKLKHKNEENERLMKNLLQKTQELESFAYSVSHDLRAPLRAINGYTVMLQEDYQDKLDEEGQKKFSIIQKNVKGMDQLINDILGFSRLYTQDVVKHKINMDEMVHHIISETNFQSGKTKPEIVVSPLPNVLGDASMINQVMVNLLSNAIKYSGKRVDPHIEIGSYSEKNDTIFFVKDNGVGFDMTYYDKLFGVFQRLHSKNDFDGTGVGLAIIRRIITKHGGKVWAKSKVGEGATFYFSLPN